MTSSRTLVAALAAALAFPAVAQTRAADEARRAAGQQPAQPGAPAAAPAAAPATGAQQGQAPQGGHQQLVKELANVLAQSELSVRVGDLAATRGSTPEVQNLGRQLAEDHRRVGAEITRLLTERGLVQTLPAASEKDRLEKEFMQLAAVTGPDFDRQVDEFLTRNGPAFVETLKRARDLTPGKDGQLKKLLDDAENVEENHLAASRKAKSNRQARTPPAR
jgi:predicted outer membrane protein